MASNRRRECPALVAMTERREADFPRRGEIWWVELPNQPDDSHTPRPALVVSVDVRNRLAGDVIVVPLSTSTRALPTHVRLSAGIGGLIHDSMAKCEQVTTLDKRFFVGGPFGRRIPEASVSQVVRAIRRAIGEIGN
jgi:mRNA interferase MazF